MINVFIFHGTGGHPQENWFPWLKDELEQHNCQVIVPQFPTPKNQSPETWFEVLKKFEEFITPDTIFIGHSLGGAFLLRVLESIKISIKASYIVSAPIGVLPIKNYQGDKPFIGHPFDWMKIRDSSKKFYIFHSDNDPYVCLGNGQKLAEHLNVDLGFIPNAGHFNANAGYIHFEELRESVFDEIRK
jgi:predicted alpha/beta hydrolase family esterase